MTAISVNLDGAITSKPSPNGCAPGGAATVSNTVIPLFLRTDNKNAATAPGNANQVVDSALAFFDLDLGGALGRVLYIQMTSSAPLEFRLTFETSAQVVIPLRGSIGPYEVPPDDRITALEVQGQGSFLWVLYADTP